MHKGQTTQEQSLHFQKSQFAAKQRTLLHESQIRCLANKSYQLSDNSKSGSARERRASFSRNIIFRLHRGHFELSSNKRESLNNKTSE